MLLTGGESAATSVFGSASKTVALTERKAPARVLAGTLEISRGLSAQRVIRYHSSEFPRQITSAGIIAEQIDR